MKYPLTFLLMLLCGLSISAQERYFHELKGLEESGQTILFYQMTKIDKYEEQNLYTDFLFKLGTTTNTDTLLADFGYFIYALGGVSVTSLEGFKPVTEEQVFIQSFFADDDFIGVSVSDTKSEFSLTSMLIWFTNINYSRSYQDTMYVSYNESGSLSIPLNSSGGIDTTFFKNLDIYEYSENNSKDFQILGISPFKNSVSFVINESGFAKSNDMFSSFQPLDFEGFDNSDFSKTTDRLIFDTDSTHIYSLISDKLIVSDDFGTKGSWEQINLSEIISKPSILVIDKEVSGSLFISDSTSVFHSTDYGNSFENILTFENEITGLYKKPGSDILYVLTRTDLYEVENGQPTSIKQVPVSNEETPEIPNTVSLKQNYPNPFNPTTTIQFELDQATFAKLTVYDVLGRKVQELVNEIRPAGTNTIQFDATNLASGIYLYRLDANGVVQTKKLTLIK